MAISMFYNDHEPPHVHCFHAAGEAKIAVADGAVISGRMPAHRLRLVRGWVEMRRPELLENWRRAVAREPLVPIPPLQ